MKNSLKRIICLLFVLTMTLCMVSSAYGEDVKEDTEDTTLKVAFYQLDGFFEYDDNGEECGYGVDYLNELKKYADIEYEYIPVDSWEDIKQMMIDGKVDLELPVSEPSKPSEVYNYTTEDVMTTYHAILTKKSRDDLYYQDFDKFKTMKFAVTQSLVDKTGLGDYFASIGVTDNIEYFDDYNSCRAALDNGEVDAVVTNIMDMTDDLKMLDRFSVTRNYITTVKSSPYYSLINNALTTMKLEEPSFQNDLYEKYYPERVSVPFTKEETEYVRNHKIMKVGVYSDREPACSYDSQSEEFTGIGIKLMDLLGEKTGLTFQYIPVDEYNPEDAVKSGKVDLVVPGNAKDIGEDGFCTNSLFENEVEMCVREGETVADDARVGVVSTKRGILNSINSQYQYFYYDDSRSALIALTSKEIDAYIDTDYVLNYMTDNPRFQSVQIVHYLTYPVPYGIIGKNNEILESVLNKGISKISDTEKSTIVQEQTEFKMSSLPVRDWIYLYRYLILLVIVAVLGLVAVCLIYARIRHRYYMQIEQKNEELEKANNAKSEFLSSMSHEIRTPMNAIIGITALAQDETGDEEAVKSDLHQIKASGDYLLQLINDILDISRIENGKIELHETIEDGPAFLQSIVNMMKPAADEKKIIIKTDFSKADTPWVKMDVLRSKQIYVNLLNNAIKFSGEGSTIEWSIRDALIDDTHMKMICVIADHGCGMSKEFQEKMFLPFEQEHNEFSNKTPGTGLGLAIVKQIIELMGGTISCVSELGKGTTFTFELPRIIDNSISKESTMVEKNSEENDLSGKRVLLAEDNDVNAMIGKRILEKEHIIVERVINGKEAYERYMSEECGYFDLILMDIRMPVLNGIDATELIRNSDREDSRKIPIIAMTADAFFEDTVRTKKAGMNAHLSKPIEPEDLYKIMNHFLSK